MRRKQNLFTRVVLVILVGLLCVGLLLPYFAQILVY